MVTKSAPNLDKKLHSVSKFDYEHLAWQKQSVVCGIDEAGCGCLAGPVVAAAVIFPAGAVIEGVMDSKLIPKNRLPILAEKIQKVAWYGVGISDAHLIDNCNIRKASMVAMARALANLLAICPIKPSKVLVDALPLGRYIDDRQLEYIAAPKGEAWSYSIAAASIVAKVKRDQLMEKYGVLFPRLSFAQHKGYGTRAHQAEILAHGQSLIHRKSFLVNFAEREAQCTLF